MATHDLSSLRGRQQHAIIAHYAISKVATVVDLISICQELDRINFPEDLTLLPLRDGLRELLLSIYRSANNYQLFLDACKNKYPAMLDVSIITKEDVFAKANIVEGREKVTQELLANKELQTAYHHIFNKLSLNDCLQIFFWEGVDADNFGMFPTPIHLTRRTEEKMHLMAIRRFKAQKLSDPRQKALSSLDSVTKLRDKTSNPRQSALYNRRIEQLQEKINQDMWPEETIESIIEQQRQIYKPPSDQKIKEMLWVEGYEWDDITKDNMHEKLQELRARIMLEFFSAIYISEASAIRQLFYLYQFL